MTIHFSFWSWTKLKSCPRQYKLQVMDNLAKDLVFDAGNSIQGSVPHAQAETFFKMKPAERDMGFFSESFDSVWGDFVAKNPVDFAAQGQKIATRLGQKVEDLASFGYEQKKAETRECTDNMARIIQAEGWQHREAEAEMKFRLQIEPAAQDLPALSIGGRVDLILHSDKGPEVYDFKATLATGQDIDQLVFYQMALRAKGTPPVKAGFVYLKRQRQPVRVELLTITHEMRLRRMMRHQLTMAERSGYPANYSKWNCQYCDVKQFCETYRVREGIQPENLGTPGKRVPFQQMSMENLFARRYEDIRPAPTSDDVLKAVDTLLGRK